MELTNKHLTNINYRNPPKYHLKTLQKVVKPHIDSFNWIITKGLTEMVKYLDPVEFLLPDGDQMSIKILNVTISPPTVSKNNFFLKEIKVFPSECREGGSSYRGSLNIQVVSAFNGIRGEPLDVSIGETPIMVKSVLCNLYQMTPKQLVNHKEETEELGGYFIINGYEKLIRMLIVPRRNYPIALNRPSWKNRGAKFTDTGIFVRCVNSCQIAAPIILHYLNDGTAILSICYMKEIFLVPIVVILQALCDVTSQYIKEELCRGMDDVLNYKSNIRAMLHHCKVSYLDNHKAALSHMGHHFRVKLSLPEWFTDIQVAKFLIKKCICTHLDSNEDKFHFLIFITKKLYSVVAGKCAVEGNDSLMMQEVLLAGHLYLNVLQEKLEQWLLSVKGYMFKLLDSKKYMKTEVFAKAIVSVTHLTRSLEYLLCTGNLSTKSGLGMTQTSGLTISAERLNFLRFISHFASIHRGAFFTTLRTSSVRKLLPESWGFICPVHTPDGILCGLLNHLSYQCEIVTEQHQKFHLPELFCSMGMTPYGLSPPFPHKTSYPVILDGCMIGWLRKVEAINFVQQLRFLKVLNKEKVPPDMEIVLVASVEMGCIGQFPGLYLFTTPARMMRPVKNLTTGTTEVIGSFEQIYLNICVDLKEAYKGLTSHQELNKTSIMSIVANLIPFSSSNQSPRNIYQCQMGKQAMGVPTINIKHRSDNKLYVLQTPQSPLVRPKLYDDYNMDEFPTGTNAIVAVISYTSYDMEDAIVVNKSSLERGFAYGSIYKSEIIDLTKLSTESIFHFGVPHTQSVDGLDEDGLPPVGKLLNSGEPFYSYINSATGEHKVIIFKGTESAYIDQIKVIGNFEKDRMFNKICFILRIPRKPVIGDKFASRHGQKGICSRFLPLEDMPFSEKGISPDIIFNPHGFPSRMTVGMMIEIMAGKSASLHGCVHDATPFEFSEEKPSYDYFGRQLQNAGYDYYGTEKMYSGIDGRLFEANIFIGVVYYQRLRHMVSDKFQVRTVGPIDNLTHQPIKGRKRGGGIRLGEMERDSLLAHGTTFLLQDRLFNCSDRSKIKVCTACGSILAPRSRKTMEGGVEPSAGWFCSNCPNKNTVVTIAIPYVFRFLTTELAAMGIKVTLKIKENI